MMSAMAGSMAQSSHAIPDRFHPARRIYGASNPNAKPPGSARNLASMYVDYSIANNDDHAYVFQYNSNYTAIDSAINFVSVKLNDIEGYTDVANPGTSMENWQTLGMSAPFPDSLTVDSVFAYITQENNSGLTDTFTFQIVGLDNITGYPTGNVLWSYSFTSANSMSASNSWLGAGAGTLLSAAPALTFTQPVAIVYQYHSHSLTDTASIAGSYVQGNTTGYPDSPSLYHNSYLRYPPFYTATTPNYTITSGGYPFAGQNWNIWAHVTFNPSFSSPVCHAAFSLVADTTTPHLYYAINQCTGNGALHYTWNWGDGSANDTSAFSSHTYAAAGMYNITVSFIDGLGCTNSFTDSANVLRTDGSNSMVTVHVVETLPSGIKTPLQKGIRIYPNPVTSLLNISGFPANTRLQLTDLTGRICFDQLVRVPSAQGLQVDMSGFPSGMYFLSCKNASGQLIEDVQKIVK